MNLTKSERETVILSSAADNEWDIVTADPRIIRYLERQGYKASVDRQLSDPYVNFKVPFKKVRILKREGRKLTDEQRARMTFLRQQATL